MELRRYLHWNSCMRVVFRISYRKDCIGIKKEIYIYASHVVAYPIFHLTKIALSIVCYGVHIYVIVESSYHELHGHFPLNNHIQLKSTQNLK